MSDTKRNPKQISRDIQSVLISQFDIDIDYKVISIAQIENREALFNDFRLKVSGIEHSINGNLFEAKVTLENNEQFFVGTHSGLHTMKNVHKIVATSTLNAVSESCNNLHHFVLDDIFEVSSSGKDALVTVVTTIVNGREHVLCGSTILNKNSAVVAVEATLNAVNRILVKFEQ